MIKIKDSSIWIYGINSVSSMLELHPERITEIRIAKYSSNPRVIKLSEIAQAAGITCKMTSLQAVEQLAAERGNQGIVALCKLPDCLGERDLKPLCDEKSAFLILDRVTAPFNLGACLRSAAVCAATAMIVPSNNSAELTPAAIKVASGAVGYVPLVRVANLSRAIILLKKLGVWIVGLSTDAEHCVSDIDCRRPTAFVMGAEGAGLRKRTIDLCDYRARIPVYGKVESFNVSVAAGICLYEMRRQRR